MSSPESAPPPLLLHVPQERKIACPRPCYIGVAPHSQRFIYSTRGEKAEALVEREPKHLLLAEKKWERGVRKRKFVVGTIDRGMLMGVASNLMPLWQIPSTKLFFRSSNFSKGWYVPPGTEIYPATHFCRKIQTTAYNIVNGSYVPIDKAKAQKETKDGGLPKLEAVGAFQKLPMVMPSIDILYSALKKAKRVSPTKGIANAAKRERNKGAKQLDALMKELAVPLRTYKENFPNKKYLHPYERSLIDLTLGYGNYEEVLGKVDTLRKKVVSVGKEYASLCAKSTTKRDAGDWLTEGMSKVEEVFSCHGKAVDDLLNIAKTLRAMPVVDLETPTLCLVGAPNVGKSSLVRILSTGKPEVCNYPFTTRGILMGHISLNYQHFQVTDTPGLLKRCDEDRNNLEKLTLAVLSYLPTAVVYVHDLSGQCGMSPSDQFLIYKEIRERFSNHLWLDVVSKCDLLQDSPVFFITEGGDADHIELARYQKVGPNGAIHVSIKSEVGLREDTWMLEAKLSETPMASSVKLMPDVGKTFADPELNVRVHELLVSQMNRIQHQKSSEENPVLT